MRVGGPNRTWTSRQTAAGAVAAAVCAIGLGGCAADDPQDIQLPHAAGSYNPPQVISSRSDADAAALASADQQLSQADWRLLEQYGPRPIWSKILGAPNRAAAEGLPPPPGEGNSLGPIHPPTIPHAAATQPDAAAANPAEATPRLEASALPATIRRVDGETLQILWTLRNYGGSTVTSSRDQSTNRREVETAQADLAPLLAVITDQLGDSVRCSALPADNRLILTCPAEDRHRVLDLLNRLDAAPPQVEINVKIFEVTQDFDFQQGTELILSHLAESGSQTATSIFSARRFLDAVTSGGSGPVQGSVVNLMQVFEQAGVSVDLSFQLLAENGLVEVVSAPRMTVAVGETGYMLAGKELPIQSASLANGVLKTSTQYKPVGVQLYITPRAAGDDHVKLHAISIVSSIAGFAPLPTMTDSGGFDEKLINPIIDTREAETTVTIGDGDTLVFSGLRMVRNITRENKIPWLGDVPGLGWMFKNHRTQQQSTDLYFFVTPHLL